MQKKYDALETHPLAATLLSHPPHTSEVIHEDDAALSVLVDYAFRQAPTITLNATLEMAEAKIKSLGVRVIFVVNDHEQVMGIVTNEDVYGDRSYKIAESDRIKRTDIPMARLMIKNSALLTLHYEAIRHVKVGHIVATFTATNQHFILVEDEDPTSGKRVIRGLFSAPRISRGLGENITDTLGRSQTLADLQRNTDL